MADGLGLGGLLGQQDRVDVGQHAAPEDGDAGQQVAELVVVPDGQLEVPGDDPGLLVVPGGVAGQLQDLGGQVLQDGGEVDGGALPGGLGVVPFLEAPADLGHWELEAGLLGGGDGLLLPGSLEAVETVDPAIVDAMSLVVGGGMVPSCVLSRNGSELALKFGPFPWRDKLS